MCVRLLIHGNTWRLAEGTGVGIIKRWNDMQGLIMTVHSDMNSSILIIYFETHDHRLEGLEMEASSRSRQLRWKRVFNLTGSVFFPPLACHEEERGSVSLRRGHECSSVFRILSGIDSSWPITISTILSLVWLVDGWGSSLSVVLGLKWAMGLVTDNY